MTGEGPAIGEPGSGETSTGAPGGSGAPPVVHVVGGGLGSVGSLTRRAARLLADAEVVVLDRPSLDQVAALAPESALRVHVGLHREGVAWSTDEVVELLAACARSGLRVVRLKGGDPHVCSRGAEEALALAAAGIAVEVTPGVTAASAAGAAAGIARGTSVTVASGNHDPAGPAVDWPGVGAVDGGLGSVVVLTGRAHQGRIVEALLAGGRHAAAPAAVVHGAGRPDEVVADADAASVGGVRLPAPAAMVVGPSPEGGPRAHP